MITSSLSKELTWIQAQSTMRKKQPQEVSSMKRCARVSSCRPEACNFIKKETLAQVVSCDFCELSKNTFVTQHLWKTASDYGTTFWHCLANTRGKWDISLINVWSNLVSQLRNLVFAWFECESADCGKQFVLVYAFISVKSLF